MFVEFHKTIFIFVISEKDDFTPAWYPCDFIVEWIKMWDDFTQLNVNIVNFPSPLARTIHSLPSLTAAPHKVHWSVNGAWCNLFEAIVVILQIFIINKSVEEAEGKF